MAKYIATLLRVEAESNPEYSCQAIEAKDAKDAEKQAKAMLKGELRGLGWTSYADPSLWGREMRIVVDVVEEGEHVRRSGHGNNPGKEGQDARFARYRKAAAQ